jgi:hypothetical protein
VHRQLIQKKTAISFHHHHSHGKMAVPLSLLFHTYRPHCPNQSIANQEQLAEAMIADY